MSENEEALPRAPASGPERRGAIRFPCGDGGAARLVVRHGPDARWARPHDVSRTGVGLLLAHPVELGAALTVRLRPQPDRVTRSLTATVVHALAGVDGTWLVGCTFERPLTAEELEQFL
jgi:hypothetical protein